MTSNNLTTDFLIIGSGAAGLSAALHASKYGQVHLLTKANWKESSSYWAQGGIAAVLRNQDSYNSHKQDTLEAGRALCDTNAVDLLVKEGAREIKQYIDLGMDFDRTNGDFDLGLEGGHSNRRVLHANGAATGKALIEFLSGLVKAESSIHIVEKAFVYELMGNGNQCGGAAAYQYEKDETVCIQSPVTILATGGYAGLFERSTNPHTSMGDGTWLAYNAGAKLQDLEFVQFHPTAFYAEDGTSFLISEAVRGEGAFLYNQKGERFMEGIKQQELAPRDVVAGEIFHQTQQQENDYVYLDVRHLDTEKLCSRFSDLCAKIKQHGVDIAHEGIPVAPAAHYCIGGIATDLDAQTTISGLYACGEAAATGVHGANRLASNSLLECLVFSKRAVNHAVHNENTAVQARSSDFAICHDAAPTFTDLQQRISSLLSRYAGISRDKKGLEYALHEINTLAERYSGAHREYFSIRSEGLTRLAKMIVKAALQREESRGVHIRSDFPEHKPVPHHILF